MCERAADEPYVPHQYTCGVSHGVWRKINQDAGPFNVVEAINDQGITIYRLPGEVESAKRNART